jgi:tartrate dehydrogenase/decarboxylase/D-malate dehydrogenase
MLDHLGEPAAAAAVPSAIETVLADGKVATPDLGGTATTESLGKAIAAAVNHS